MFDIEQSLSVAIYRANQSIKALFKEEFGDCGITPKQFILLLILWEHDGLTQIELSKRGSIDRATMGGIIDRLEKKEFLVRRPSHEDRRVNHVWLTEQGRSCKEEFSSSVFRVRSRISARMTPEEFSRLHTLLIKLLK